MGNGKGKQTSQSENHRIRIIREATGNEKNGKLNKRDDSLVYCL